VILITTYKKEPIKRDCLTALNLYLCCRDE